MEIEFKTRADLYELAHLFGVWLEVPEFVRKREEVTGKRDWPNAIMFFGSIVMVELFLDESPDDPTRTETTMVTSGYRLGSGDDVGVLFSHEMVRSPDGEMEFGDSHSINWAIDEKDRLSLMDDENVWMFQPATVKDVIDAGYPRRLIEEQVAHYKDADQEFVETFNEDTVEELKALYWKEFEEGER